MLWSGWGEQERAVTLPPAVLDVLAGLGVRPPARPRVELAEVRLPAPALPAAARAALEGAVGAEHVHDDQRARVLHTRGKSTADLLRIRSGEADDAPDAVVLPGSHEQVLAVLAACTEHRVAVVPFGGGTGVVGGLSRRQEAFAGMIALDLGRMKRLLALDEISRTATLEPGLRGPEAEALVAERGFTIGHHPQSFLHATIGGFAAARSSGQASAGYGRFDELVVSLRVATPAGTLELGRAPRSGAGPDLRQLVLGSEGAFGVITAVTVELRPAPAERRYEGWRFGSFAAGVEGLRALAQDGPLPSVLRLADEAATAINLTDPSAVGATGASGSLAVVGYEGSLSRVDSLARETGAALRAAGAEPLGPGPGESWLAGRYSGPYLRDPLLDAGVFVETYETATWWSNMGALYERVGAALREALGAGGGTPIVLCHVSHVYRAGASLYFTGGGPAASDPIAQARAVKQAVGDAVLAAGGTITHHHGVGRDHREHYAREIGPLGVEILRAVKARLDPAGILNPGVLVG